MKNATVSLLLMLCCMTARVAYADSLTQRLQGGYEAKTPWKMSLRTIVMGDNNEVVAAELVIGNEKCSGAIAGLGKSDGKAIKVRPYPGSGDQAQSCQLTIVLDKSGTVATVSAESCSDFHGAQCEFKGVLRVK